MSLRRWSTPWMGLMKTAIPRLNITWNRLEIPTAK